jgi:hypothetical protein
MLSKTEREATKLLQKAKYIYKFIPDWMRLSGPELLQNNVLKMSFNNDSVIESMPSANEPARGESVYLAIIDEMAFLPNPGSLGINRANCRRRWSSNLSIYCQG